jgi:hypothetical protein
MEKASLYEGRGGKFPVTPASGRPVKVGPAAWEFYKASYIQLEPLSWEPGRGVEERVHLKLPTGGQFRILKSGSRD